MIGNDEFSHRQYPCDFQRTWNITQSLEQTKEYKGVPLLYLRFNPNFYQRGKTMFDAPLATGHQVLLSTLNSLQATNLKSGLNLVYIHYDTNAKGDLCIFDAEDNDSVTLFRECVLNMV